MQIFYASREGQSRRIAERIAARLTAQDTPAVLHDLAAGDVRDRDGLAVLVAPVRYGKHLPEAERFLAGFQGRDAPLVFLSVNLTARKPGKQSAETNQYLLKALLRHKLKPLLAEAIAGRLDYPRYGWLDRTMIRLIMKMTGGPTDPTAVVEYTDWNRVDAIADEIAQLERQPAR